VRAPLSRARYRRGKSRDRIARRCAFDGLRQVKPEGASLAESRLHPDSRPGQSAIRLQKVRPAPRESSSVMTLKHHQDPLAIAVLDAAAVISDGVADRRASVSSGSSHPTSTSSTELSCAEPLWSAAPRRETRYAKAHRVLREDPLRLGS